MIAGGGGEHAFAFCVNIVAISKQLAHLIS